MQHFRTDTSVEYGDWLVDTCGELGIKVIESRPWDSVVGRIIESIL